MKLEEVHRQAQEQPSKFQVIVEDNYHYMEDDDRRVVGTFDTYEKALAAARKIVTNSVKHCAEDKRDAGEIHACYVMFGEDAWILPTPEGVESFSGRTFAQSVAEGLADGAGQPRGET